jgi:cytidylate kinase
MAERLPRSIEQIVEEQARRFTLRKQSAGALARRPLVTISRQHGAGGEEVARRVARELELDLFDREIIHEIARSAQLSDRVVDALDEKDRDVLTDWLVCFAGCDYLSPNAYHDHLLRVIGAIGCHGGAVILGRGAHLILGPERALRVSVVAPLEMRVADVARSEGLSQHDAQRRIAEVEGERRAFLARQFRVDPADLSVFDLIVNTAVLGSQGAVSAVCTAALKLPAHAPALVGA